MRKAVLIGMVAMVLGCGPTSLPAESGASKGSPASSTQTFEEPEQETKEPVGQVRARVTKRPRNRFARDHQSGTSLAQLLEAEPLTWLFY
jgi:hypothetical protein